MSASTIGLVSLAAVVVLIALRMPIAVVLMGVSVAGIWAIAGELPALGILTTVPYNFAASWTLSSVPMFLFMGFAAFHTGLTQGLFNAARVWLGTLPGGLVIASIFGAGGFSAVTGSSVACSAAMGRIAVPEMHRAKYDLGIATGSLAAAGTVGALIPPSIILILYGILAQVSITTLFKGGLVVGVVSVFGYAAVVLVLSVVSPAKMPRGQPFSLREKINALNEIWPTAVLIAAVFGGLFSGFFTATEAGAVGAIFTILIGLVRRTLTRKTFVTSCVDTLLASGGLFMIAVSANVFTRLISLSGLSRLIGDWIMGLGVEPTVILIVIALIYVLLGMFLEPIGAMLLTLPLMLPITLANGIDTIWFGILLAKLLEIGMITPPVGLNVFVMHSVARDLVSLEKIFYGVAVFLISDVVIVGLMIATWSWF